MYAAHNAAFVMAFIAFQTFSSWLQHTSLIRIIKWNYQNNANEK